MSVSNGNLSALYRAIDLRGVLSSAAALCGSGRIWCLIWPTVAYRQILHTESPGEPVDLLVATQIERLLPPSNSGHDALGDWSKAVVSLLGSQFSWLTGTTATGAAFRGSTPLALVGVTGLGASSGILATESAHAIERAAILEAALQDGTVYRHLLGSCTEALLVIQENGRIVAGTEEGRRLLLAALYGTSRSPFKGGNDTVPAHVMSSILVRHTISLHGVSITARPFGGTIRYDLADPLVLVTFRTTVPTNSHISSEDLAKLTPAQKEVFQLLIAGERNKEIATHLGISPFTARNHVSAILQALRCGDRLELIARVRLAEITAKAKPKVEVPFMVEAQALQDMPIKCATARKN